MTTYADPADFKELALPPGLISRVSDDVIARFLGAASLRADSLGFRARYTLPLLTWDDDVRQNVCQLAVFPLMCFAGFNPDAPENVVFKQLTDEAARWFRGVAGRTVHPAIADSVKRAAVPMIYSPKPLRGW
jgi:hypothetical protein